MELSQIDKKEQGWIQDLVRDGVWLGKGKFVGSLQMPLTGCMSSSAHGIFELQQFPRTFIQMFTVKINEVYVDKELLFLSTIYSGYVHVRVPTLTRSYERLKSCCCQQAGGGGHIELSF